MRDSSLSRIFYLVSVAGQMNKSDLLAKQGIHSQNMIFILGVQLDKFPDEMKIANLEPSK